MVNAGAIATTALIKGNGREERRARILQMFQRYTGRPIEIDREVFLSERATGHRNRAIACLELNAGMIDERVDEHLDLYFEQCSVRISARDLAVMAATLANNGVSPLTGERALEELRDTALARAQRQMIRWKILKYPRPYPSGGPQRPVSMLVKDAGQAAFITEKR